MSSEVSEAKACSKTTSRTVPGGVLGIVAENRAWKHEGEVYVTASFGCVVDQLAERFERLILAVPVAYCPPEHVGDYRLRATNIELLAQPFYSSSLAALRQPIGILRAYWRVCHQAEHLFIRGMLPFSGLFYLIARVSRRQPCHWIVGDPISLLRTHRRSGYLKDAAAVAYARLDRVCVRFGRWLTRGKVICNGQELFTLYRSQGTTAVVSSTITEQDFFERLDTCQNEVVRILFVGFVRPEKGVEYLLTSLAGMRVQRPWELVLVGSSGQFFGYRRRLEELIQELGIGDKVVWRGHVPYGLELFRQMREADLLVLPTLSEGTPRVLVEARANSLPVIASNVGGIPSSVSDGVDGVLVPPKDTESLKAAIERLILDGDFRRMLIKNGFRRVRTMSLDRFIDAVVDAMED